MQITGSEETVLIRGFLLLSSSIALLAAPVWAQEATLVVENGRVIVGDGTVLERGTVVVAGHRVLAVTEESVEAPQARRMDVSGKTVLPGLIDAHVHLTIDPRISDSASLEAGKLADLIVVDGNPLEDLSAWRSVDMVVKDGKVVFSK